MIIIGLFNWIFGNKLIESKTVTKYKLITDIGDGYYAWNGNIYKSDIVRSCIRPTARAVGKLSVKHIRENGDDIQINPDNNIKYLLEYPNPLMTGQMLREKLATQLELNSNAFAWIKRDEDTFEPLEIYPLPATSVDMLEGPYGDIYLKFYFMDGKEFVAPYVDIIHLRQDFNNHNIFGENPAESLTPLMEVVNTTDQGIIKAIKNSNVIRWLLTFKQTLRPEDLKKQAEQFVEDYLSVESKSVGVAATDAKADAQQVEPKDYVPNENQMEKTIQRIYSFFNTNENIVQSKYNEDEWNAYYEAKIEPIGLQLNNEYTRKLFSKREIGHGNKIVFESLNLQYASMKTKLELWQMVDRGALLPNEWRKVFNLGPVEGGNKPIRRLDTAPVKGGDGAEQDGNEGITDEQD